MRMARQALAGIATMLLAGPLALAQPARAAQDYTLNVILPLTGGAAFILTSASSYGVAALLPIRDQGQLAWGYLPFAALIGGLWLIKRWRMPAHATP